MRNVRRSSSTCAAKFPWVYTAPFGAPVLPLVNRIAAVSSCRTSGSAPPAPAPDARTSSRVTPPHGATGPTVTRSRADLAQPSTSLARCASGTPRNASGSASARHPPIRCGPIPGSISTGTAPALNSPKVSANSSPPGLTSTATRLPWLSPIRRSPRAIRVLSSSSSR